MKENIKISVVTPVYNGGKMIQTCIESVMNQTYDNVEQIIVDGGSSDDTLKIIKSYSNNKIRFISEKDKGSCDAINKGILMATGDVICFLCSDDFYSDPKALEKVSQCFNDYNIDACYSDLIYVDREDISKIKRYWESSDFKPGSYLKGWMAPSTSFYVKRNLVLKSGLLNLDFGYAGDFELTFRLLEIDKIKTKYIPQALVKMRQGGISTSTVNNILKCMLLCYDSLKFHKVKFAFLFIFYWFTYRLKQVFATRVIRKNTTS